MILMCLNITYEKWVELCILFDVIMLKELQKFVQKNHTNVLKIIKI